MSDFVRIDDFSGGLLKLSPSKCAPNQAWELSNLVPIEGNLQTYPGNSPAASGACFQGITGGSNISDILRHYTSTNPSVGYTLLTQSPNGYVFIDTGESTYPYRPILLADNIHRSAYHCISAFGKVFISTKGMPMRWDNFIHHSGTVQCIGNASLVGTGTQWTSNIKPGDTVFIAESTTPTWNGSGPYYVQSVDSTTGITLTGNGPNTSAEDRVYIIGRVHEVGMFQPTDPITVTASAGAGLGVGVYQYMYTYGNSWTNAESNQISTAFSVTTDADNSQVTIGSIGGSCPSLQIDQVHIYRTLLGGSLFYYLTTLNRDQTGYTWGASFVDDDADSVLDLTRTAPTGREMPPGGGRLAYWNNRLFAHDTAFDYSLV